MSLNKNEHISDITKAFSENGLSSLLTREVSEKFALLTEILLCENEKYNLTAIKEPKKIAICHYADCAAVAKHIEHGATVVDVGCGAGFPSLPLAIVRPDLKILGVDSTAKRTNYVMETAKALELQNIEVLTARAEDVGRDAKYREKFDIAIARAVAALPILTELCLPLVKVGGKFLAMKGKNARYELNDSKRAISMSGGKDAKLIEMELKGDEGMAHPLIIIDKAVKTPATFPRSYAQISKKPL